VIDDFFGDLVLSVLCYPRYIVSFVFLCPALILIFSILANIFAGKSIPEI